MSDFRIRPFDIKSEIRRWGELSRFLKSHHEDWGKKTFFELLLRRLFIIFFFFSSIFLKKYWSKKKIENNYSSFMNYFSDFFSFAYIVLIFFFRSCEFHKILRISFLILFIYLQFFVDTILDWICDLFFIILLFFFLFLFFLSFPFLFQSQALCDPLLRNVQAGQVLFSALTIFFNYFKFEINYSYFRTQIT